jgi:serine/threonine protein kinase
MSNSWEDKKRTYRREAETLAPPLVCISAGPKFSIQLSNSYQPNFLLRTSSPAAQEGSSNADFLQTPPLTANVDYSNRSPRPTNKNPALRTTVEKDPYQHLDFLGNGAYGYVDTVKSVINPGAVFARKTIRITAGRNREVQLKSVETEFEILRRLKNNHVIQVLELYSCRNKLSIIMLQVADTDMKEYLETLDMIETGSERHTMLKPLLMWQGCLIQAIDYLHEMKIKHKDLKPANILIKNGHVLITDFGIAKDLIDEETTASVNSGGAQGSPMYMAPEIGLEGRRGRAVDIFSLGCIFLEISTCLIAGPGARARFTEYRNLNGSCAYSRCAAQILNWIWYLWGWYAAYNVFQTLVPAFPDDSIFVHQTILPGELAFMMLDPNPKTRITSRQLVQRIHTRTNLWDDVKMLACGECNTGPIWESNILPLHSTFKENKDLNFPRSPEQALTDPSMEWEFVKRLWLDSHMWW